MCTVGVSAAGSPAEEAGARGRGRREGQETGREEELGGWT